MNNVLYLLPKINNNRAQSGGSRRISENISDLNHLLQADDYIMFNYNKLASSSNLCRENSVFNCVDIFLNFVEFIKIIIKLKPKYIIQEVPYYWLFSLISLFAGIPTIYSAHNNEIFLRKPFDTTNFKLNFVYWTKWSFSENISLLIASKVLTISPSLSSDFANRFPFIAKKLYPLYPQIKSITNSYKFEHDKILQENSNKIIRFGFLGSFDWQPNHDAYIYFMNQIIPKLSQFFIKDNDLFYEFSFIGSNNCNKVKDKNISVLGFSKIIIQNYIKNLPDFYQNHDIIISPIMSGSGIKMKVFEALQYSKPIIMTKKSSEGFEIFTSKLDYYYDNSETFALQIYNCRFCNERLKLLQKSKDLQKYLMKERKSQIEKLATSLP